MIYFIKITEEQSIILTGVHSVNLEHDHTIMRNERKEIVGIFKNSDYQFVIRQSETNSMTLGKMV